ncbi:MAG: acyltransferase [Solirubrobacteraceae bacterium]
MSPADAPAPSATPTTPAGLIAAPSETESRSWPRWVARVVLVLLGLPKSIAFNLRYLPTDQAIRLPILVSHRMAIFNFNGTVTVPDGASTGSVLLGFGANGAFDFRRSRSVWQNAGAVVFEGPARLGHGFKLVTADSGTVRFGPDFVLSAESQIVCRDAISFGPGCLVSWEVLLLDTDYHPLIAQDGSQSEICAPIVLGERVWLGARSTVLKGVTLGNDTVVAAGAVVNRSDPEGHAVLGGNPARRVREGVRWQR